MRGMLANNAGKNKSAFITPSGNGHLCFKLKTHEGSNPSNKFGTFAHVMCDALCGRKHWILCNNSRSV